MNVGTISNIVGTNENTIIAGTKPYLAPELYIHQDNIENKVSVNWEKCDVFSLGVSLWRLMTTNLNDYKTFNNLNKLNDKEVK